MVRQVELFVAAGQIWSRAGTAQFFRLPVRATADFRSDPGGILTLEEARRISHDLASGKMQGNAGRYAWLEQGPPP